MKENRKRAIAVIGDRKFTLGFKLAGVEEIHEPDNYKERIKELSNSDEIGILVASKEDVRQLPSRIRKQVRNSVSPVVVELSETSESSDLREKIKNVIGADIG